MAKNGLFYLTPYTEIGDFSKAYKELLKVNIKALFEREATNLNRKKAFFNYHMGSIGQVNLYLDPQKPLIDPSDLLLKSYVEKEKMNYNEYHVYLRKALDISLEKEDDFLLATVHNNYGVFSSESHNMTDAIHYYTQSAKYASKQKKKDIIHTSYQNLINVLLINNETDRAEKEYLKYKSYFDDITINDQFEILNFDLEIARQRNNRQEIVRIVQTTFNTLSPQLSKDEKQAFNVSMLRIVFNHGMTEELVFLLKCIYDELDEYFLLQMPEKLMALKGIAFPLYWLEKENKIQFFNPFAQDLILNLLKRIKDYMANYAIAEIDEYLATIEDYEVHLRCNLSKDKIAIQKDWCGEYNFERVYKRMQEVKDIYLNRGLVFHAFLTDLDICDECCSPINSQNGILKTKPKEILIEHLIVFEKNLEKLKTSHVYADIILRVAYYCLVLDEREKSRKYFQELKELNVSINHFAKWLKDMYTELQRHLS